MTVIAQGNGVVGGVEVLTFGASNLDYADAGGTCGSATFSASGQTCIEQVKFTPGVPGPRLGAVVLLDGTGNLLGTSLLAGTGSAGLAVFSQGNLTPVAGNGGWNTVKDGIPASEAELNLPASVVLDGAGNIYIADSQHDRIRIVSSGNGPTIHNSVTYPQAGYIATIAGNGSAGFGGDNGLATSSTVSLNDPTGLAIDGAGNLYIADTANNIIREIVAATGFITTIAGNRIVGDSGDYGPALRASLNNPGGVSVDPSGTVYLADTNNHKIRAICSSVGALYKVACTAPGNIVTLVGTGYADSLGGGGLSGDNGPAISAELNYPYAVAFDAAGNMYIPDSNNNRVRRVNPTGTIISFAGNGSPNYSGDGGPADLAGISAPSSVQVDSAQNVLICDSGNSALRKVNALTTDISTMIKSGGEYVSNQVISTVSLYGPRSILLDPHGNVYIADYYNMRVREIMSNVSFLDFTKTPTQQGDTSTAASETIENDGNAPVTLTSITADGNSQVETSSNTCAAGTQLAVDAQCVVSAEFAPTITGDPLFANITVEGQAESLPLVDNPLLLILAGDSPAVNSTTINVSSSQNPSSFNQNITITATVSTGAGTGALTGTLTFYDGTTQLAANVPINSIGNGSFSISTLSVGTHSITVDYGGDSKHFNSTSSPIAQVVDENTFVALTTNSNPVALGSPLTLTATVSIFGGGGVTPDGQVAFLDGTTLLNTVNINASGVATLTTSQLTQGAHNLTAVYSGDPAKYISGTSSANVALNVIASTTLGLSSTPNPSNYGTAVAFTATLTPAIPGTATGTISIFDSAQQIGSVTLTGASGIATFTTHSLSVGTNAISASYSGDQNFGTSTSNVVPQVVDTSQTTTIVLANPSPAIEGTQVTLTATVAAGSGAAAFTGTVTFTDGSAKLASIQVGANGVATFVSPFSAGTHLLAGAYSGDSNNGPSASSSIALIVNPGTTQVALSSSGSPAEALSSVTFHAAVSGNGVVPTGKVTFTVDGATATSVTLDAKGNAAFSDTSLAVGSHTIGAAYSGDGNNEASSGSDSEIITAIPTNTDLTTSSAGGNTPETILVASTGGASGPVPTGTIRFLSGGAAIGTAALDSAGVATFLPELSGGAYNVSAQYGGDAVHAPSTSAPVSISGSATSFAVAVTPPSLSLSSGQNGTMSITMGSISGFSDSIQMGCLGLPAVVTCTFSSDVISLKSGQTQTVQVTVDSNSPLTGGTSAKATRPGISTTQLAGIFFPGSLGLGCFFWRFRKHRMGMLFAVLALSLATAFGVIGCGAGFSSTKAAAGTYTIQIGGTGITSKISQFQNITLTITK